MKTLKSSLFNMIAALLGVSVLSALALGYVYEITKEPIARAKDEKTLNAIREVIGSFDNNPFAEKTTVSAPGGKYKLELYPARENGIITAVAVKSFSDNGFGGRIELIVGLLRDGTGVEKIGGRIASIRTESGIVVRAMMFIYATFEGDLMAAAGCSYMTGRESNKEYGETFNGYRKTMKHNYHFFKGKVSPYREPGNPSSGLLKFANIQPRLETGTADKKIQAYCFRMCLTLNPDSPNWKKIEKPANYNPEDYEMLLRAVCSEPKFFPMIVSPMPNFKSDCNNRGAVSLDFIGGNYNYPEASYAEREKIVKAHLDYQTGLVYFLQNDPRVPKNIQDRFKKFGYSKDEFVDTGHMPFYLYVREARRMKGEYVMTQHDCQNARSTPDPVGMGSYGLDSHNTSRFIDENGFIQNEGDVEVWLKKPYKIAYGAIIPQKSECQNLLVPVACSSTHIAYGSIRMEPVFMILGHSAAAAASMAIDEGCAVQDIDRSKLSSVLLSDGQVLEHKAAPKTKK